MNAPLLLDPRKVAPDTHLFTSFLPVPGLGTLPVNAFLIRAAEPVLIDTGVVALGQAFFERITSVIDAADLRWIWLTHLDADHMGCFDQLLAAAPKARVVTTFLGMGKLGLSRAVPPERIYLLNPGQSLDVGDRQLLALKPACYDAPETTGLFDPKTRVLFSSDCFGGLLPEPVESAAELAATTVRDGIVTWASVDMPWLRSVNEASLDAALGTMLALEPELVLSSHLPPARGMAPALASALRQARLAAPFVGPDQAALQQMMTAA
jgi:flavorubredoxin